MVSLVKDCLSQRNTKNLNVNKMADLRKLYGLAYDNPPMEAFIERHRNRMILRHIDDKCAIVSDRNNQSICLKYVPFKDEKNKSLSSLEFHPEIVEIVRRGLSSQSYCQGISSVQKIFDFDPENIFYQDIFGLIGPLEYIEGKKLYNLWKEFERRNLTKEHSGINLKGAFKALELFQRFEEETLDPIHKRGVLHRDIKPGNLIKKTGEDKIYVIDWSIAARFSPVNEDYLEMTKGPQWGTPGYMPLDSRISKDGYGLGVSFAETLVPSLRNRFVKREERPEFRRLFRLKTAELLSSFYGNEFADYFISLLTKPAEYKPSIEIRLKKLQCS